MRCRRNDAEMGSKYKSQPASEPAIGKLASWSWERSCKKREIEKKMFCLTQWKRDTIVVLLLLWLLLLCFFPGVLDCCFKSCCSTKLSGLSCYQYRGDAKRQRIGKKRKKEHSHFSSTCIFVKENEKQTEIDRKCDISWPCSVELAGLFLPSCL